MQNVGAYGADVSQTIAAVRTWDRERNAVQTFTNSELKFGYRDSILKQTTVEGSPRYVVLTVEFQLPLGRMSAPPIKYAELARVLGVEAGKRAYSNDVRREVLRLRASKGMVLDSADRDTYSTAHSSPTRSCRRSVPQLCRRTRQGIPLGGTTDS